MRTILIPFAIVGVAGLGSFFLLSQPAVDLNSVEAVALSLSSTATWPDAGLSDVRSVLHETGLDAESLTAVNASPSQAAEVVARLAQVIDTFGPELDAANLAIGAARPPVDMLERRIQSGAGDENDPQLLSEARQALASAIADRSGIISDLFGAGTSELDPETCAALLRVRHSRHWHLPAQYLVVERDEQEWIQLRDALTHERQASAGVIDEDGEVLTFLANIRANQQVAAAAASLIANLSAVSAAMEAVLEE